MTCRRRTSDLHWYYTPRSFAPFRARMSVLNYVWRVVVKSPDQCFQNAVFTRARREKVRRYRKFTLPKGGILRASFSKAKPLLPRGPVCERRLLWEIRSMSDHNNVKPYGHPLRSRASRVVINYYYYMGVPCASRRTINGANKIFSWSWHVWWCNITSSYDANEKASIRERRGMLFCISYQNFAVQNG